MDGDELEAVSGGEKRDFGASGCSATVEEGSWCVSDDECYKWDVVYTNIDRCPNASRNHECVKWVKIRSRQEMSIPRTRKDGSGSAKTAAE